LIEAFAKDCALATHGKIIHGSEGLGFRGVSINSRTVQPGELFVCIQGDRFDGHDFLSEVLAKKVAGIMLSNAKPLDEVGDLSKTEIFVIQTQDTLVALQDLARFYRSQIPARVIGVTGTNGKSTTKEMIACVSETRFKTHKTEGNLNNHIGLPLSVLKMDRDHEVAVLEMGMSGEGEIRLLADIARPDTGLITNISEAHLEELKTIRNVQAAKGELFSALEPGHTAIINADDPLVLELANTLRTKKITYGIENPADVRASEIRQRNNEGFDFKVKLFDQEFSMSLPFLGACNIYNALAAVATGHSLGLSPDDMSVGLGHCRLMGQRYEIIEKDSITLINDAYNANPRSMEESLKTLVQYETSGRKILVIGDMLELGDLAQSAHRELGEKIAKLTIDLLVTVGDLSALVSEGALHAGMRKDRVIHLNSHDEAKDFLRQNIISNDCLLFKASRGARLEEIIHALAEPSTLKEI
jgi:UDP-N-acetylmuramoyl-tripeptide--D-alanyl-D-alanine ligase